MDVIHRCDDSQRKPGTGRLAWGLAMLARRTPREVGGASTESCFATARKAVPGTKGERFPCTQFDVVRNVARRTQAAAKRRTQAIVRNLCGSSSDV